MMEKDNMSISTVQMKPDYAASDVYSTASEAPPAYKRPSNSVKIAKITAFTVITASCILGTFILASAYLQAKASCGQVQALDSILEKELMLETLQQVSMELPRAEAIMGKEKIEETDVQNLDNTETVSKKLKGKLKPTTATNEEANNNDNNVYTEGEEAENVRIYPGKLPVELDLSDLAAALLQTNKKLRVNCVLDRKQTEDTPLKNIMLPFGINLGQDAKNAQVSGERISIYCEGGNENNNRAQDTRKGRQNEFTNENDIDSDVEGMGPMFVPYQREPIPFGTVVQQYPLTHMPQRAMPHPQANIERQITQSFPHVPMRPPLQPPMMKTFRPEPPMNYMMEPPQQQTMRVHVQELPYREIHISNNAPQQASPQQQEFPYFQIERLPLSLALQRAGFIAEGLRNIQQMAEARISDELRHLTSEEASESAEKKNASTEDTEDSDVSSIQSNSAEQRSMQQQMRRPQTPQIAINEQQPQQLQVELHPVRQMPQRLVLQQLPEQPRDNTVSLVNNIAESAPRTYGSANFGRSLVQPVRIPVPMMQAQADISSNDDSSTVVTESERFHFVQPRSV